MILKIMMTTVLTTDGIVVDMNFKVLPLSLQTSQSTILSSIIAAITPIKMRIIPRLMDRVIKSLMSLE